MKRFLLTLAFVCLLVAPALGRERIWGFCSQGGSRVQVGGQKSTAGTPLNTPTYWMQTYPGCTVTVYLTGTNTLATIYSDNSSTPLANPFTADAITGYWEFYPDDGRYDVRMSGGNISTPFTLSDLQACDLSTCGGGGGTGLLTSNNIWTGTNSFKSINSVRYADQFPGADWGAKVNAADADLGSTAGEIWVNQNAGLSNATPVVISANHILRFAQGGTYNTSAGITLNTYSSMIGGGIQATRINYTGTGVAIDTTGGNTIRHIFLNLGASTTDGFKLRGSEVTLDDYWVQGGGNLTKLVHVAAYDGTTLSGTIRVMNGKAYDYTGTALYVDHVTDVTLNNLSNYAAAANTTATGMIVDTGVSGLYVSNVGVNSNALGGLLVKNATGGVGSYNQYPNYLFFSNFIADAVAGEAPTADAILFDSTLGTNPIYASFVNSWAAGYGLNGFHISGGQGIHITGGTKVRSNGLNGVLVDNANVADVLISNSFVTANNTSNNADGQGVYISAAVLRVRLVGNIIGNTLDTTGHQRYGFKVSAVNADAFVAVGNDLKLNETGYYSNGNTGEYNLIGNTSNPADNTTKNWLNGSLQVHGGLFLDGGLYSSVINNVRYADQYSGADGGAKLIACVADLPSGGTCDARGFGATTQTISSTVATPGTVPVTILLDPATTFQPASDALTMFSLGPHSHVRGMNVDTTNRAAYSGTVVITSGQIDGDWSLTNTRIKMSGDAGTCVNLYGASSAASVVFARVDNAICYGGHDGLLLSTATNGWVNGNTITNFTASGSHHAFEILVNGTGVSGNQVSQNKIFGQAEYLNFYGGTPYAVDAEIISTPAGGSSAAVENVFSVANFDYPGNTITTSGLGCRNTFQGSLGVSWTDGASCGPNNFYDATSVSLSGTLVANTINKLTITTPTTNATLTINNGKTLTVANTMQLASTDSAVLTFQGTDTYVGRATTDTLANKTLNAPIIQSNVVASLPAAASSTGMIYVVTDSNAATACTTGGGSNVVLCRSNGSAWLPLGDGASSGAAAWASITGGTNASAAMLIDTGASLGTVNAGTIQATNVLGAGLTFAGSTSGTTILKATAIAGTTTLTLPAATDTLVGKNTTDTLTNKTLDNTNAITVKDGSFTLQNTTDVTKQATFTLAGITTGNTRVITVPDAASTTVVADTGAAHNFLTAISAAGAISKAQPAFTDLSGNIAVSQMASGTGASSSTWWRGDGTWASLPGGTGTVNSGAQYAFTYYATAGTAVSGHPDFLTNAAGNLLMTQGANNTTALQFTRNTDTTPTGKYLDFLNVAASSIASLDITGNWIATSYATSGIFSATGSMGTCPTTATSKGSICFSSTGNRPVYGYNAGSNSNLILASDTLAALASTTSAQLAGVISDETGSGSLVFATSPTLVTPVLGVATATSINKLTITTPATGSTLTINDGKTLAASASLTLTGTDGTTMTFPSTSANIFGSVTKADVLDAANFCSAAGASGTTYTCSLSPAITTYVTGTHYRFKADVANTGAATINLNALGAKTIKKAAGGITTDLVANDLRAGQWVDMVYDGTNMQMQSATGNAASGTISSGTTNALAKYTASTTLGGSLLSDDGTTLTYTGTGGISVAAITITGTAGADTYTEIVAPATPAASSLKVWADSTDHRIHDKNSSGTIGTTVVADTGAAHNFITAISAAGVISKAQPACADISDAGTACTATIANYAPLASPTFTGTVGGITATMVGLGSVTNDAQTKAAIVPNTAPSAGQLLVGNAGGTAYAPVSMSQDCTIASTGVITCTKTNNVAFATSATTDTTNASNVTSGTLPAAQVPAVTVSVGTSTPITVSTTLNSAFYYNEHATAATAITYNLPTAAAGKQFCFANAYNGSAANTGVLAIATSAAGQYIIYTDGTLSASGGNIASGGAAGDAACVVGVDTTHWLAYVQRGTWTKN